MLAVKLNCSTETTKLMVECFRTKTPKELIAGMKTLFVFMGFIPLKMFGPAIEKGSNPFISEHPYKLIKDGKINDVPLVLTNVNDEGIFPIGRKVKFFDIVHIKFNTTIFSFCSLFQV